MSYEIIHAGGENRVFSLQPRKLPIGDSGCCTGVVGVEDAAPALIERKDWPKFVDLTWAVDEILNQGQMSLCHSFAGTQLNQMAHKIAGRKDRKLSAGYLAGLVTGHRDEGASVDDVLTVLKSKGQCLRSTVAQNDYQGRDWPKNAEIEALEYRPLDIWDCSHENTFSGVISNLINRNPVEIGTNAFGGPHAVVVAGYFSLGGKLYVIIVNSWGAGYTNRPEKMLDGYANLIAKEESSDFVSGVLRDQGAGYAVFSEQVVCQGITMFGAFAAQAVVTASDDTVPTIA
jgi:hypothetical protein